MIKGLIILQYFIKINHLILHLNIDQEQQKLDLTAT